MIKVEYDFKYTTDAVVGKHCFIYRGEAVEQVAKDLGREGEKLCIKVFYDQDKPGNWGDEKADRTDKRNATIQEATRIQNICAFEGLAPRVYAIIKVEWSGMGRKGKEFKDKVCDAQVTEDIGIDHSKSDDDAKAVYDKIIGLGFKYGWQVNYKEWKRHDLIQGKFVDFQSFNLIKRQHREKISALVHELGKWGKTHYQAVPELEITNFRKTEKRIVELGLDKIDFKGKTVLDLGCSSGVFANYAASQGAKRVVGIDMENPVRASQLLANFLEYHNNDYKTWDLLHSLDVETDLCGFKQFDIIFFLSMLYHVGYPKWIKDATKELLVVEWNHWHKKKGLNVKQCEQRTRVILEQDFAKVDFVGRATDHGDKAIWHCTK
ncbi:hypothetical protein LCGC14_1679550 [marine sediment metagenome]|uniref:Methyltransferase domain-containing protein n=1 Tax=marine sediment metagenome TaxID=412755 RepID=A0A0F9K4U7_9ZZZZ